VAGRNEEVIRGCSAVRRAVYALILIIILALFGGFSTYLALGQGDDSQFVTVTVTATPDIVWQPPPEVPQPPGEIARSKLWLNINSMDKLTRHEMSLDGKLKAPLEVITPDYRYKLEMAEGTRILTAARLPANKILVERVMTPPLPPSGSVIIGDVYDFNPSGITFEPPARLVSTYNLDELPQNTSSVVIAHYDPEQNWIEMETEIESVAAAGLVATRISHLTMFAILAKLAPPAPASFECSLLSISPTEVDIGETVNVTILVANTGGQSGSYQVALRINSVTVADREVALDAGASEQVGFSTARDTAGTYSVNVNGLTGTFIVKEKPAPVTPAEPMPVKPIIWWLIGGIIVAVVVVTLLIFRPS
jgi:hypothetical protein